MLFTFPRSGLFEPKRGLFSPDFVSAGGFEEVALFKFGKFRNELLLVLLVLVVLNPKFPEIFP